MNTLQKKFVLKSSGFVSCGQQCCGDLYLPENDDNPPVVIMAHGFGAERNFGLPPFAEHFVRQGMAVYLFDYRSFGDSEGQPRNYISPARHLKDWKAAIAHVRSLPEIDTNKIALWGSSFSGGHVIATAARTENISAIVAQVPFVDPISTTQKLGFRFLLRAIPKALRDILSIITLQAPHYVKIAGKPDEFALMNTPESYPGYMAIVPTNTTWQNQCPARILFTFSLYRPIAYASKVKCPALVMVAENDSLIDPKAVSKTAARIPLAELVSYPIGHFDIYSGAPFEEAIETQTTFLLKHLRGN